MQVLISPKVQACGLINSISINEQLTKIWRYFKNIFEAQVYCFYLLAGRYKAWFF
jgi:hypothetical protein